MRWMKASDMKRLFEGRPSLRASKLRWMVVVLLLSFIAAGVYVKVLVGVHRRLSKRLDKLHKYQALALRNQEVEKRHRRLAMLYDTVIEKGALKAETPSVASATLQERLYKMASAAGVSLDRFNLDKVEDLGNGIKHLSIKATLSGWLGSVVDLLYALEANRSPLLVVDSLYIKAFSYSRARTSRPINCTLKIGAFYMETPR